MKCLAIAHFHQPPKQEVIWRLTARPPWLCDWLTGRYAKAERVATRSLCRSPNKPLKLRLRYEKVDGFHSSFISVVAIKQKGRRKGGIFLLSVCLLMRKLQQSARGRERRRQTKAVVCGKRPRGARQRLTLQKSGQNRNQQKHCAELLLLPDRQQDLLLASQLRERSELTWTPPSFLLLRTAACFC